jgi:hypothetical protein
MEFRMTKRQAVRGSMPDGEANGKMFLIKKVSELRATYQVRLLLHRAVRQGTTLVLDVPNACKLSDDLTALVRDYPANLEVSRS